MVMAGSLVFAPPRLITDQSNGTACCGPWWDGVIGISDTHAIGWVPQRTVATTDAGRTWGSIMGWADDTRAFDGFVSPDGAAFLVIGNNRTFISAAGKNENVTGVRASSTTLFSLTANGSFARETRGSFAIDGLPYVDGFRFSNTVLWLRDGHTQLATAVTAGIGSTAASRAHLSVVALHSTDGGYRWKYTGVVAADEEVPYAHEGPSENALAYLSNGSVLCVMRVEGESGHHSPYISKVGLSVFPASSLRARCPSPRAGMPNRFCCVCPAALFQVSDDEGSSWRYLRSLRAWPGFNLAPGC